MLWRRVMRSMLFCLLLVVAVGCGDSGPATYPVSGTVTYNNEPLPEGDIVFTPVDRSLAPDAAKIVDGSYQGRVKEGKKRVEISASREVGEVDPVMNMRARAQYIPARYNAESELQIEVSSGGENAFSFELTGE